MRAARPFSRHTLHVTVTNSDSEGAQRASRRFRTKRACTPAPSTKNRILRCFRAGPRNPEQPSSRIPMNRFPFLDSTESNHLEHRHESGERSLSGSVAHRRLPSSPHSTVFGFCKRTTCQTLQSEIDSPTLTARANLLESRFLPAGCLPRRISACELGARGEFDDSLPGFGSAPRTRRIER